MIRPLTDRQRAELESAESDLGDAFARLHGMMIFESGLDEADYFARRWNLRFLEVRPLRVYDPHSSRDYHR